jgi:transposase
MPRAYSVDLRVRVIGDISTGASRREAAERYGVSPSVVVLWAQRFGQTGSVAAKPSGGSTSPLEEHTGFLLDLITGQPDLTLDEVVAVMRKRGIPGRRSAAWRFFDRRDISFKTLRAALSFAGPAHRSAVFLPASCSFRMAIIWFRRRPLQRMTTAPKFLSRRIES